jgi:hypothetical protein
MGAEINHAERAHARLSASGSERWMNCPASPALEENFPDQTSIYAEEGTLAHELSELILRLDLGLMKMPEYKKKLEAVKANKLYSSEMWDEVLKYTTYVKQQYQEAKREDPHAKIYIEHKMDLTEWIPEGFGTSDCIIVCNLWAEDIDLKYGKGKAVYAERNSQLMTYGLGAMREGHKIASFAKVRLTIVQPRLDSISSWEISTKELREWGETVLKPKALEAYGGEGEQKAGDWCQFCKARSKCRALYDQGMAIMRRDFEEHVDPRLINDEELFEIYLNSDFIAKWLESVRAIVLKEAMDGKQWPGHKLVEGRSNRTWTDEKKAIAILEENLYEPHEYLNSKIKGLGDLEKLLKKANFEKLLGHLIIKPQGAPTLVSEADKREPYGVTGLRKDFGEFIEEDDGFDLD